MTLKNITNLTLYTVINKADRNDGEHMSWDRNLKHTALI